MRQIHYATFHERRVEVLEDLYKLVVKCRAAFPRNVPMGNREALNDQGWKFLDALGELQSYSEETALWLDDEIKRQVQKLVDSNELGGKARRTLTPIRWLG